MNILASIITFNPDIQRLKENVLSVQNQVNSILLIDNGSDNIKEIVETVKQVHKVNVIYNNKNLGVAKALKQAMEYATMQGFDWVLTLDQDSVCSDNLIKHYLEYSSIKDIGIITCNIIDRNLESRHVIPCQGYEEIKSCITSGSFMNVDIYKKLCGFNEKLFIDCVDFDICAQMIESNYRIIRIYYDGLLHEVGHGKTVKLLWKKYETYNHSELRQYYMARNWFYLSLKYPLQYNLLLTIIKELRTWIILIIYERNAIKKIHARIKGIRDYKKVC